jgi:hypothetical protein
MCSPSLPAASNSGLILMRVIVTSAASQANTTYRVEAYHFGCNRAPYNSAFSSPPLLQHATPRR